MESYNKSNIDRFSGFSDVYDKYRPSAPETVTHLATLYLNKKPETVADIGCGSGLSTFLWTNAAENVIGIEPNDDMRQTAINKITGQKNIKFIKGLSNETTLPDNSMDVVTFSQSFHWVEPFSTLNEINRILKPNGILMIYDQQWPVTVDPILDDAYEKTDDFCDEIADKLPNAAIKTDKTKHFENVKNTNHFSYVKKIYFSNIEKMTAERLFGLLISQGGAQKAFKTDIRAVEKAAEFDQLCKDRLQDKTIDSIFSYQMIIAVK